jgi:hypothetical protein|tara:strand:+ start:212 stop:427 length:216 start_codon:yes stop_codon:yes gene_type:complete
MVIGEQDGGTQTIKLHLRVPVSLRNSLQEIADTDDRSVNYIVKKFLEKCVHAFYIQKNFEAERARKEGHQA